MKTNILDKMKAEGWQQRFTASGARLREAIDNYSEMGFEVKTIPVKELATNGCTICLEDENDDTAMLFTRKIIEERNINYNDDC